MMVVAPSLRFPQTLRGDSQDVQLRAIYEAPDGTIYAGAGNMLVRSDDGGVTWSRWRYFLILALIATVMLPILLLTYRATAIGSSLGRVMLFSFLIKHKSH